MNYKENAQAALDFIQELPEDSVDLKDYTVGQAHCLAGWLPYIEHFKELGVTAEQETGAPRHPDSFNLPRFLFNTTLMFSDGKWAPLVPDFPETTTDKAETVERLKWVINE